MQAPRTDMQSWLPTTRKELEQRGWDWVDVILFSGDAYVDHPSFGVAVIGRVLEAEGLRVAIVPQPNWRDDLRDFKKLGRPRLFFGVSAGAMDSMVNHYTANKRLRSDDAYTPDGRAGMRPDYPTIVYTRILKQLYPDVPVVIGGIEASLRRVTHYDYWQDCLRPGILIESGADFEINGVFIRNTGQVTTGHAGIVVSYIDSEKGWNRNGDDYFTRGADYPVDEVKPGVYAASKELYSELFPRRRIRMGETSARIKTSVLRDDKVEFTLDAKPAGNPGSFKLSRILTDIDILDNEILNSHVNGIYTNGVYRLRVINNKVLNCNSTNTQWTGTIVSILNGAEADVLYNWIQDNRTEKLHKKPLSVTAADSRVIGNRF